MSYDRLMKIITEHGPKPYALSNSPLSCTPEFLELKERRIKAYIEIHKTWVEKAKRKNSRFCNVEDCEAVSVSDHLCQRHYRLRLNKDAMELEGER